MFLTTKLKIKFLFIFIYGTSIKIKIHFFKNKNSLKPLANWRLIMILTIKFRSWVIKNWIIKK